MYRIGTEMYRDNVHICLCYSFSFRLTTKNITYNNWLEGPSSLVAITKALFLTELRYVVTDGISGSN